jgi:hypothetical protein
MYYIMIFRRWRPNLFARHTFNKSVGDILNAQMTAVKLLTLKY